MNRNQPCDFYEIQKRQWQRSIFIFAGLILFYFLAIGIIVLAVYLSVGAFAAAGFLSGSFLARLLLWVLGIAALIAVFHYYDARKFGAAYILKRLEVREARPLRPVPQAAGRYGRRDADRRRPSRGQALCHTFVRHQLDGPHRGGRDSGRGGY